MEPTPSVTDALESGRATVWELFGLEVCVAIYTRWHRFSVTLRTISVSATPYLRQMLRKITTSQAKDGARRSVIFVDWHRVRCAIRVRHELCVVIQTVRHGSCGQW